MSGASQLIYKYIEPFKRVFYDKYYKEKIQFGNWNPIRRRNKNKSWHSPAAKRA